MSAGCHACQDYDPFKSDKKLLFYVHLNQTESICMLPWVLMADWTMLAYFTIQIGSTGVLRPLHPHCQGTLEETTNRSSLSFFMNCNPHTVAAPPSTKEILKSALWHFTCYCTVTCCAYVCMSFRIHTVAFENLNKKEFVWLCCNASLWLWNSSFTDRTILL